jgi:uncharacterized protein with PQ loop repeat
MLDWFAANPRVGDALGILSSICFGLQYLPQAYLNFKRKSVKGFSTLGIIIKLAGASFLLVNSFLAGEAMPVVFYGLINVVQHSVFILQFSIYPSDVHSRENFFHWLLFPIVPYFIGVYSPQTIAVTNAIKPITQVLSHIPQLKVCVDIRTTAGVSMMSQHFNLIGGMLGLAMCLFIPPKYSQVYFIYGNSVLQALSIYVLYFYYDFYALAPKKSELPTSA